MNTPVITKNTTIQLFRAIAIIAVVVIHTLPLGYWQVFLRPFVNFAVAVFFFLSGYLTKANNDNWKYFYRKGITRVISPYIIWTLLYSLSSMKDAGISVFLSNLLTAKAAGPLYFILVYIQFVLLTPLICWIAKSRYQSIGWFISPIAIVLYQIYLITSEFDPNINIALFWDNSFLAWFIFYYLGIILGNKLRTFNFAQSKLIYLYIFSLAIQMGEGYWLNTQGFLNCGTQVKISSIISSSILCLILYNILTERRYGTDGSKILLMLGDYSFGIFLCHIMIMKIIFHIPILGTLHFPLNTVLVLSLSLITCYMGEKLLGYKGIVYLGLK